MHSLIIENYLKTTKTRYSATHHPYKFSQQIKH